MPGSRRFAEAAGAGGGDSSGGERGRSCPRQALLILDAAGRVVYAARGVRAALNLPETETIVGELLVELLAHATASSPQGRGELRELFEGTTAGTPLLTLGNGRSLRLELTRLELTRLEPSAPGDGLRVATLEDLTAEYEAEQDLAAVAYRDPLTGLWNRALFEQRLESAAAGLARERPVGAIVLFLDLDRFKVVNDTLGHAVGDELLRLVAQRLQSCLGPSDTLARMGGDEFAILLEDPAGREAASTIAAALAAKILDLVPRTYLIEGQVVNIGVSIGIALAPGDGTSGEQILKSADLALYHSKAAGRGVFHFFAPAMQERAQRRRALELDLRKALVLRQFELFYQPQIDVRSQTITGLEALLRWRHPVRGLVPPLEFLPVADEIGLAVPIGEWVLKTACREATRWPVPATVAVNVSPLQFESGNFTETVRLALEAAGLPGARLEVEVTEDILQRTGPTLLGLLGRLRELGVRVAMANFGTGLASLSQVVRFPFDKIKIDRALIGLHQADDAQSRAIVRAISSLGQSLGITTLAEGIETPEHLERVQAEGCGSVQGFYYSKPVAAGELSALFASELSTATTPSTTRELRHEPVHL